MYVCVFVVWIFVERDAGNRNRDKKFSFLCYHEYMRKISYFSIFLFVLRDDSIYTTFFLVEFGN